MFNKIKNFILTCFKRIKKYKPVSNSVLIDGILYKPVSNLVLIDGIREIQKIVRKDFSNDEKTREMCFDLIRSLEEAALNAAEKSGNAAAAESLRQASKAWWEWVEIFDNVFTRPFRNPAIDPEYCSFDNVRARCLRNTDEARAIIRLFRRSPTSPKLASYADILERDCIFSKTKPTLE